jgi:hypothetical protein
VVGRSGDLGSIDSIGKRGASAELAARRVDDTGSDQHCGKQMTIAETICLRGVDAHGAPAGRTH